MFVERDIKGVFSKVLNAFNVVALVGARQAGKTTFLKEEMKGLKASYVLFDDPDAKALFEEDVKKFERQFVEGFEVTVLDEVQYCKDAGTKLKYLADSGHKLWLTASSDLILSKDVLSFLVGRVSILRLYPFSLAEFLLAKNIKEFNAAILKRSVWEHLAYGGYPAVVLAPDTETKKIILRNIYETMILKDIAQTFSIDDIKSLEEFCKYLAVNIGSIVSFENVCNNLNLSFQTVKKYLAAMQKSYLVATVNPFFTNKTKEITKQPKIYFIDTGLRNAAANTFGIEPEGKTFENYVLSELLKAGFSPKYWRTKSKAEVDFIIEEGNTIIPIEVKLKADDKKIGKSLQSFIEAYKPKNALIISYEETEKELKIKNCKIQFINANQIKQTLKNITSQTK